MPKGMTSAQYMRERRAEFRARSGCKECGRPTQPNKTLCKEHAEYNAKKSKERREKLRVVGLCISCGKRSAEDGKKFCTECLEHNREKGKKWRECQKARKTQKEGEHATD